MSHPRPAVPPDPQVVRTQLQRVLSSREFANAERMRRFLELSVAEALAGRGEQLKEYIIGVSVFDRPTSFDPGVDPIVRVEARRLRAKLEKYYSGEGQNDRLLIELPKGRYAARFQIRDEALNGAGAHTIAVLPFQNLSPSPDGQYFSDGLTWELIHHLTRIEGLSVVAWNSVERLRETPSAMAAAATLKAATVLTGSVRQAGTRLRVIAQLIDGATGVYLWSENYDRELSDIFAIEDAIARAIVIRLQSRLSSLLEPRTAPQRYDLDAYRLYLNGRAHWNQRTRESLLRSLECFRRATEIDPQFALGHAGIADANALLADYGMGDPAEIIPAAKEAALRAIEIDPSLGEAYCSLALLTGVYEWRWLESEAHFHRALELNPGYATAHHWLSVDLLASVGRFDEALEEIDIARKLDPLSAIIGEGRGYLLMLSRRYEESAEHYRALIEADPSFHMVYSSLGRTLLQMGRYDEAIQQFEKARQLTGGDVPNILSAMGQAYALKGDRSEALRILATLHELSRTRHVSSTSFAIVHIGLGELDQAIQWVQRGMSRRELPVCNLATHPVYDPLRQRPEYREFIHQLGLENI